MKKATKPIHASEKTIKTKSNGGEIIMKNKKSYFKQILSTLLVLCMMAAFIPAASANTEETATGVKVVYDFKGCTSNIRFDENVTYANSVSNGRFAFGATNETASNKTTNFMVGTTYTQIAASVPFLSINLSSTNYWAMKIRMPKNKSYNVAVNYVHTSNSDAQTMSTGIWILPASTTNIATEIKAAATAMVTIDGTKDLVDYPKIAVLDTESGTFSSGDEEEYLLVFKRLTTPAEATGIQLRLFSVELSEINTSTETVYEALETVPFYGTVSAISDSLTDDAKRATLSVSDVYMSDGTAAPAETDLSGVTYVSSDESIIAIDGSTAIGIDTGEATISAYLNDVCLGSVDMTSTVTPKTGIKVVYDFKGYDATSDDEKEIKNIKYDDGKSFGRMEFHGNSAGDVSDETIKDASYNGIDGSVRFGQIGISAQGQYFAFKVRMPKNKKYEAAVNYVHYNSGDAGANLTAGMWILPTDTVNIVAQTYGQGGHTIKPGVLSIDGSKKTAANKYATMERVTGTFESGNEEEYLLVFAKTETGKGNALRVVSIELSEIDEETGNPCANLVPVPLYSEGTINNSVLDNTGDTATVGISTVYMSDGTAAEAELSGVTYVSSDETVATVSGTTVTATGAGRATVYPVYNGVSLGAHGVGGADVEVSAVNEDGNPAVAADGETAPITNKVITLTAVLGEETKTEVEEIEDRNADGSVTVTAAPTDGAGNVFLYWAKGLKEGAAEKVFIPDENAPYSCTFKPSTGMNYIIAVYGNPNAEVEDKYFNANGQLLSTGVKPTSASMPGYGTTTEFADCGFGIFMADYNEANEASYRIIVNNNTTEEIRYVKYGNEVTVTAEAPFEGDNFRFWKKRTKDGEYEIVSFKEDYTFYAFEDCEVTAVYTTAAQQATAAEAFRKIILTNLGGDQFMTEFIGFEDAVEKGIAIGTKKISMTTDATQFTLNVDENEENASVKGYAIDKNGNVYYAD